MKAREINERNVGFLPGLLGVEVLEIGESNLKSRLEVRPELLAPNGYLHAATAVALADTSCGWGVLELARMVGRPRAARAVGGALATNPIPIILPCHRVIRHDGGLGEYALRSLGPAGREVKRALLRLEEIEHALLSWENGSAESGQR